MSDPDGIDRREFVKAAVAIGGGSALSACLDRGGVDVPPQASRHAGYETAFLEMEPVELTI